MSVILIESDLSFGFIHFWSSCLFYLSLISRTHINKLFYLSQQKLLKPYNKLIFKKLTLQISPLKWFNMPLWFWIRPDCQNSWVFHHFCESKLGGIRHRVTERRHGWTSAQELRQKFRKISLTSAEVINFGTRNPFALCRS